MSEFKLDIKEEGDVVIISTDGYLNNVGGEKIAEACYEKIDGGKNKFLLNLERSSVVNSIGVSILIEIIEREPVAILKVDPLVMIDGDGIILPDLENYINYNIPVLTNFNIHETSYNKGKKISSDKVIDCVDWLKKIKKDYSYLYENLSELKITSSDEIELILFDHPTYIYLGLDKINYRLEILKKFEETIKPNKISDYTYLDLRYKNQIVVKEKHSWIL